MRPGIFLSTILHGAIFGSAYVVFPMATTTMSEETIIVPVELVTIDDTTNLTTPQPDPVEEPEPEPTPEPEEVPPEEEPIPDEDAEVSDEPDPFAEEDGETESEPEVAEPEPEETPEEAPEPEETPEPEPTPTPEPKVIPPEEDKKEKSNSFFDGVMTTTQDKKKSREREYRAAPDFKKVENVNKNVRSAGDRARDTATWTAMLRSKLETSGCYRDPRDMANYDRLQVTYAITFTKDGRLMRTPRRLKPTIIPQSDRQLRTFDLNAQRAIEKCVPYDDIFPAEHYEEWKDFEFNFAAGN